MSYVTDKHVNQLIAIFIGWLVTFRVSLVSAQCSISMLMECRWQQMKIQSWCHLMTKRGNSPVLNIIRGHMRQRSVTSFIHLYGDLVINQHSYLFLFKMLLLLVASQFMENVSNQSILFSRCHLLQPAYQDIYICLIHDNSDSQPTSRNKEIQDLSKEYDKQTNLLFSLSSIL